MPEEGRVAALEKDYRDMAVMIFGEPPAFAGIMETLAALEQAHSTYVKYFRPQIMTGRLEKAFADIVDQ